MNNLTSRFLIVALIGVGSYRALAQTNSVPEKIVHTLKFPQGDAAWTVTFTADPKSLPTAPAKTGSPAPSFRWIKKVDIVRMGNLRRDKITWSIGPATECWWSQKPPLMLFQDAPDGSVHVRKAGNVGKRRYDASLFEWVNPTTFVGIKTFMGKECRCYETEVSIEGDKMRLRAWIDNETSRPVAHSAGDSNTLFSFDVPFPAEPLVLPAKFEQELTRVAAFLLPPKKPGER